MAPWKEAMLTLRSSNRDNTSASQENQAVTVGWNNRLAGADTTGHGPPASYSLELPPGLSAAWGLGEGHTLDFLLAPTHNVPEARDDPARDQAAAGGSAEGRRDREGDDQQTPVDLSIELADAGGCSASVVLSDYSAIRRPLENYVSNPPEN